MSASLAGLGTTLPATVRCKGHVKRTMTSPLPSPPTQHLTYTHYLPALPTAIHFPLLQFCSFTRPQPHSSVHQFIKLTRPAAIAAHAAVILVQSMPSISSICPTLLRCL